MEFRLLGPVEVQAGDELLGIGHARQRAVLAVLMLDPGRVITADRVIDRVWGEDPPTSVRNTLSGYVARLRPVLGRPDGEGVVLARRVGGYVLDVDPEQVDLFRFRRLAVAAAAASDIGHAASMLGDAIRLWRGSALAGLDSRWLNAMRDTLELERHAVLLDLSDVRLRLGEHAELVSELASQAAVAPADERLIGQLMLALYRCGRQAEALRRFEQTRVHLAEHLRVVPGPQLRVLHEQILRGDPRLAVPAASATIGAGDGQSVVVASPAPISAPVPVPRELPPDVAGFTGRVAELTALDDLLLGSGGDVEQATAAVISAVSGTAGVGKTALAVHWAHRAAGQFPDGQLHVNLRGYDPSQPVTAADALAGFLRSLGVPGPDIPPEEDQRAAKYRSMLAGTRTLVVLDNASTVEQVRPLLPGSSSCAVVVTSRDSLAGLVARDGARRLDLDLLPPPDAIALLRELLGAQADAEPDAVTQLAEQCARLPLALRVAAELAAARPAVPIATLVTELTDRQRRLDALSAEGDPRAAVRVVLSWSYDCLDEAPARAFRLAGLHPGPDFEPYAIAALTDCSLEQARRVLDTLTRAHLAQLTGPGRHGMHDLLQAYARDIAAETDGEQESRAALTRLFDYYLSVAAAAMDTLYPAEQNRRPRVGPSQSAAPPVTDPDTAKAWLASERASLAAVAVHAADHGWLGHATLISGTLFRYLQVGVHTAEELSIFGAGRRAAREAGDLPAEAAALIALGVSHWQQDKYQQAADLYRQALALSRQADDRMGQGRALLNLGQVEEEQGAYAQAERHYRQSLVLSREVGDRTGEAIAHTSLGNIAQNLGRLRQASESYRQALALMRKIGGTTGEAIALANLGLIDERLGRHNEAGDYFEQALALFRQAGDRRHEAYVLSYLGKLDSRPGHYPEAMGNQRRSVEIHREIGDLSGEADARNDLGVTLLAAGQRTEAQREHEIALSVARQISHKHQQARAYQGLGNCYDAAGDDARAGQHWEQAIALFTELGMPEADEVRARLDDCAGSA
jgi:DNA-binding SARP family transcriptional activator/Tfp pilus assembly protein PilF